MIVVRSYLWWSSCVIAPARLTVASRNRKLVTFWQSLFPQDWYVASAFGRTRSLTWSRKTCLGQFCLRRVVIRWGGCRWWRLRTKYRTCCCSGRWGPLELHRRKNLPSLWAVSLCSYALRLHQNRLFLTVQSLFFWDPAWYSQVLSSYERYRRCDSEPLQIVSLRHISVPSFP